MSPFIRSALEPYFPEKELVVFTYEDGTTEGNYFSFQSRNSLDIRYRTKETSASAYRSRQYVITLVYTPKYELLEKDPNHFSDYECLTKVFRELRSSFAQGFSGRAERYLTKSYFDQANTRLCNGRLGGIFLHYEPPAQSNIIQGNVLAPCLTESNGSARGNQACSFPFKYEGVENWKCTNRGEPRVWCSVKTNKNGDHMRGEWGYCPNNCAGRCLSNDSNFCWMNGKLFHIYWLADNRKAENWRWRGYIWVTGTE